MPARYSDRSDDEGADSGILACRVRAALGAFALKAAGMLLFADTYDLSERVHCSAVLHLMSQAYSPRFNKEL